MNDSSSPNVLHVRTSSINNSFSSHSGISLTGNSVGIIGKINEGPEKEVSAKVVDVNNGQRISK